MLLLALASCVVGDDAVDDSDGDDVAVEALTAGDAHRLNIGFNDGLPGEFDYYNDFFSASAIHPGPRLCHAYVGWDIGTQPPHAGDPTSQGSRAYLDHWLASAQGHCDDALISFQAYRHGPAPLVAQFAASFDNLAATSWAAEAGFTGAVSYTPWNEPNNGAGAGNGLGTQIAPRLAARYYLAAERACRQHDCKVAAGDFASNGAMWRDFSFNCENDTVAPAELCAHKSSVNAGGAPASYLDLYKNEIANRAQDFGLPAGFRPPYFAFHGWHDTNEYLDHGDHCSTYESCGLRRILKSLGGSWGRTVLWDTEDGLGQTGALSDEAQACGAAFLLRLQTITPRVYRLYVTRLHGGSDQLLVGHAPRPAMTVLANRELHYAGGCR